MQYVFEDGLSEPDESGVVSVEEEVQLLLLVEYQLVGLPQFLLNLVAPRFKLADCLS